MLEVSTLLLLIPGLPLLASILTAITGPRLLREKSHVLVATALVSSFFLSLLLVHEVRNQAERNDSQEPVVSNETIVTAWNWVRVENALARPAVSPRIESSGVEPVRITTGDRLPFDVGVTLRADALTAIMLAMVTFVSSIVAIFSVGYMHGETGYWRFFSYIGLFVFSMTMLVSVSNFLLLYVFWEAVGACSYLLIGFWYKKPEAAAAGKKAFLVNRVGDFGFALAIFLIWMTYGTLNFHDAGTVPGVLGTTRLAQPDLFAGGPLGTVICLLLLLGACGKSAQFPLHIWLPDAMEGPTPVSALIHAATMVTAGVYMVVRCTPLFMVSPDSQLIVAVVGGFTALLAGAIAFTQTDLKRILAYSTISQLGYMFLSLGTGTMMGITAGMFHLFTHAFFKALLFLGAGSVMHAMGNVIDIGRFSGLRRLMPVTCWTFLFGCLALSGVFPFAGFWSKDAILAGLHDRAGLSVHAAADHDMAESLSLGAAGELLVSGTPAYPKVYAGLYYTALFTAFLTAMYTFRAFFLTFFGPLKVPHEAGQHAHESPLVMTVPLVILAGCALGVGALFEVTHGFSEFLALTPSLAYANVLRTTAAGEFHLDIAITSSLVALSGIGLAAFFYLGDRSEVDWITRHIKPVYRMSRQKFYFDEIYSALIVLPLRGIAAVAYLADRYLLDGIVDFFAALPGFLGRMLRPLQTGLIQFYALAMVLGLLVLAGTLLIG